ncbi:MAG: uracil-DNA glycosylase [Enhygromyxa sp.]
MLPFTDLPEPWKPLLGAELDEPYFQTLREFVACEREEHEVYPPPEQVFAALEHTPPEQVRVLLLGQDPYHDAGQAQGLCFSVRPGVRLPPSLRNVYKELEADLGVPPAEHGSLMCWADRGVLLLNTVLTVRAHKPNSHRNKGWERFTDRIIEVLAAREQPTVFVLWGKPAQAKIPLIEAQGKHHEILCAAHPSPFSAKNGFFGSKPFSRVNEALAQRGLPPIDWSIRE